MRFALESLRDRKLFHWAVAYVAGAWVVMQVVDVVSSRWPMAVALQQSIDVALAVGFFVVLVIAWYHGEKGRQHVSGRELLLLALLLGIGVGMVRIVGGAPAVSRDLDVSPAAEVGAASIVPLRKVLVDTSMSWIFTRMRPPARLTLPSATASTASSRAMTGTGFGSSRYRWTDVREMTLRPPIFRSAERMSSCNPSTNGLSSSGPQFSSGRTATAGWPDGLPHLERPIRPAAHGRERVRHPE